MKRIDLTAIPETGQHYRFRIDPEDWRPVEEEEGAVAPAGPMEFEAEIQRAGRRMILNGHLQGRIRVRCDRCLKRFERDVDTRFRTFLALPKEMGAEAEIELGDEDLEVEFTPEEEIDALDLVREQLLLEQPMKNLCSESCKGLCSSCGADLNEGACSCSSDQGHPAFRKLEALKIKGEQD
ncbi:MAG: DUF177 domain-containing protein [Deltaproteobacteria bacterium]|nr:DUF177 domain-containing protein [Deltaproteobacteria bacterium]